MRDGYRTGRGRVVMRATCHFEDVGREGGKQAIIIDELPYQVNKANLLIKIGELVREKQIDGISDLRDESDKSGMRVYIELKRGENADVILNNLYKQTQMQDTFGMNMVALIDGQPRLLNLREMLDAFLRHRREVVTRRTVFDLKKARERGHILEGLAVALANVDEIVELIKSSETPVIAKDASAGPCVEIGDGRGNAGAHRPRILAAGEYRAGIRPACAMAITCPKSRRSASSRCNCSASPIWNRTRSLANTRRSWTRSPTCSISWPIRRASPRSSAKN